MKRKRNDQYTYERILPAVLLACMLPVMCGGIQALAADGQTDSVEGAVMQLSKTEGDVEVSNSSGKSISLIDNMKLYNGYRTETEEASYAWINLDSEKLVKLDAVSEAEVRKKGKKLEMLLDSGSLFFNVTEDLKEDEAMNIRTSTMVMGIRGTSGMVKCIDQWHTQVYILEGTVQCHVTDPVTGQVKEITLTSGECADFYAYPQEQAGDKCDIITQKFTEDDINGFALVELVQDVPLCGEIEEASGLDILELADTAQQRLDDDEEEMRQIMAAIREKEAGQEHHISQAPVWKTGTPASGTSGSGTGNGWWNPVSGTPGTIGTDVPEENNSSDSGLSAAVGSDAETVTSWKPSSGSGSGSKGEGSTGISRPVIPVKPDPDQADPNEKARQAYQTILDTYRRACTLDYSEYSAKYLDDWNQYSAEYPNVNNYMLEEYYMGNVSQFYYAFHDVNGDGIEELIIGLAYKTAVDDIRGYVLYSYDKNTDTAVVRFKEDCGTGVFLEVMDNGTIVRSGDTGKVQGFIINEADALEQVLMYEYGGNACVPALELQCKKENGLTAAAYNWNSLDIQEGISEKYVNPLSQLSPEMRAAAEKAYTEALLSRLENQGVSYTDVDGTSYQVGKDTTFNNLRMLDDELRVEFGSYTSGNILCLEIPFVIDFNDPVVGNRTNVTGHLYLEKISDISQSFVVACSHLYQDRQFRKDLTYRTIRKYVYSADEAAYVRWQKMLPSYAGTYINDAAGASLEFAARKDSGYTIFELRILSGAAQTNVYEISGFSASGQCMAKTIVGEESNLVLVITPENGQLIIESTGADPGLDYLSGTYHRTD